MSTEKLESKTVDVLIRCLKSFDFWAQSTWFIGSITVIMQSLPMDIGKHGITGRGLLLWTIFICFFADQFLVDITIPI